MQRKASSTGNRPKCKCYSLEMLLLVKIASSESKFNSRNEGVSKMTKILQDWLWSFKIQTKKKKN